MSLKIIHTRPDGTKVPLKVSIWDAFKGVPDRKPRKIAPVKCPCCGKVHCGMPKQNTSDGAKAADDGKTKVKDHGKKDDNDLADDDRIILRMKGEDPSASWKDIMAATSTFKHPGEVKARFRDIKHHLDEESEKKDKITAKEEIARRRKEEGLRRKAEKDAEAKKQEEEKKAAEEKAKEEAAKKENEEKKSTTTGKGKKGHQKNRGIALAAKHFDKTGVRITPREALKLAEGK
ncbi:hypothetical protein PV04_06979 [Phialophora macrospora]|uniref:Uncharacterized protein n=1 Tax=Phialophora macrospora TaxID=1851006 RepID=A0A0D2FI63_9EURO|nr:hypothetical protein PV04_06979 [Phialophora macrospora]